MCGCWQRDVFLIRRLTIRSSRIKVIARISPWSTYIAFGLSMIIMMLVFAAAPRNPVTFVSVELLYRAFSAGCYVALLGIVMTSIGKGAASSKVALMWSLTNLSFFYPTLIEGFVHDRAGTTAMLLTDASLGFTGFMILMLARKLLASPSDLIGVTQPAEALPSGES